MGFESLTSLTNGGALSGGDAAPSSAFQGPFTSGFDSSGWAVNFGSGSAGASSSGGQLGQYVPFLVIGAAVLIAWRMTRRR